MKFHLDDDTLTITLEGWERVWALKRHISIPLQNITELTWRSQGVYQAESRVIRGGGTSWPGAFYAGHFYEPRAKRWHFMYVRQPQGWLWNGGFTAENLLVIRTRDYSFSSIALTVQPDIGEQIVDYWQARRDAASASRPIRPFASR